MSKMKQRMKQAVRRAIGEPYVGKRLKLRSLGHALAPLHLNPRAVIDAGAEDATFAYWLADRWPRATVTAIDIDQASVDTCAAARPRRYADRVRFECSPFDQLPPESADLVTAFDVLEHIEDDHRAIGDLSRALRPGGTILVHVPRDQWTHADGRVEVVADVDAWQVNEGHVRMGYSVESLAALCAQAGLEVVDTDLWVRRWGVRAHSVYRRLEHPRPARLLSVPFTDVAAILDRRRPASEGNYVWMVARKS